MKKLALCLCFVLAACKTDGNTGTPPSPAPSAASSATPLPSAPPAPWFAGSWSGDYAATAFRIEPAPGAVKEWAKDDGTAASGPGKLTLRIDADGSIAGEGAGALGSLEASGQVDGEVIRVALRSTEPTKAPAFFGVLLAARSGEVLKGNLQASSGDSLTVRQASFELKKSP